MYFPFRSPFITHTNMISTLTNQATQTLLTANYVGHLAVSDSSGQPYVVPVTYFFDADTNSILGYSATGRKIDILRSNPKVSLAVTEVDQLNDWKSVVIEGTYGELDGMEAMQALQQLLTKLPDRINGEGQHQVEYIRDMAKTTPGNPKVIYRIHITSMGGRFEQGR